METYIHFCMASTGHFIMFSGITKIYYRKTLGHLFTKPVQIEVHVVGPCHHGMAHPQVADREMASDKEGSCE
jgi:hypothetical protein